MIPRATNDLPKLLTTQAFLRVGEMLVATFIGILLVRSGFSLTNTVLLIAGGYVLEAAAYAAADKIVLFLGLKRTMQTGILWYVLYFWVVSVAAPEPWWIVAYFLARSMTSVLFWFPYHVLFASAETGKKGVWVGANHAVNVVVTMLTPLAGGVLISYFGAWSFFAAAALACLLGIIPSGMMKHVPKIARKGAPYKKDVFAIMFFSAFVPALIWVGWPLIVYSYANDVLVVGYLLFLVGAVEALGAVFTGRHFDKRKNAVWALAAGISSALVLFSFSPNILWLLGSKALLDIFLGSFETLRTLVWYTAAYERDLSTTYQNQKHAIVAWMLGSATATSLLAIPTALGFRMEWAFLLGVPIVWYLGIRFKNVLKKRHAPWRAIQPPAP